MKNTTFLIHIQEMDCPVEKAEIEKYFAKNPDFEPVATDLMHRTMRFVAKSEKATSKLLLENLKKAGFPGEVVNEADGTTSPIPVRIPDLDSEEKVEKLKKAFENDTAFEVLTVNLADKSATFTKRFPEALTEDLFTKLASLNLPASEILSTEKKAAASESHWGAFRLGVALVLAGCGEAFEIAGTLNETAILAVCLAAIALSGIKTLIKGICNLPCFVFNMNTLMAVAVLGAVAIGQYPEAAMVMVLYEIGEAIARGICDYFGVTYKEKEQPESAASTDKLYRAQEGAFANRPIAEEKNTANSSLSAAVVVTCRCARPVVKPSYVGTSGKPYIYWSAVDGAGKYYVYRSTSKNGTYEYIGYTAKTNYTDSKAVAGTTYYYKVKAISKVRSTANSSLSAAVAVTCRCARPSVKITTSNGDPKLTWNAVTGASQYEVYRATSKNGSYTKMFTTSNLSYTNTSAKAGTTYYYKVKAVSKVKSTANSAFSTVVSIRAR